MLAPTDACHWLLLLLLPFAVSAARERLGLWAKWTANTSSTRAQHVAAHERAAVVHDEAAKLHQQARGVL